MASSACTSLGTVAQEILGYLRQHPKAQDTLEGINAWWLLERRVRSSVAETKNALEELIAQDLVLARASRAGPVRYSLAPQTSRGSREAPEPPEGVAHPMPNPVKKWTVMVYLAGDNNLDSAGVSDLNEMKQVGSNNDLNVLAQFDRAGATAATMRYCLRQGTSLPNDAVQALGETNMGDPAVLQSFVEWGISGYPAAHYLLVLWNHGNGWDDTNVYRAARSRGLQVMRRDLVLQATGGPARGNVPAAHLRAVSHRFRHCLFRPSVEAAVRERGIAYDDQAQDFLDNREVKRVLTAIKNKLGRKLDVLGMDACLMNMVEVAYQVRDSVAFVAGSEETEPGAGWPYHTILADLAAHPDMAPRDLSASIVSRYLASYGASSGVTQSALDQAEVARVRVAIEALGTALRAALTPAATYQAIHKARQQVRHYTRPDYIDLVDYCKQLKACNVPAALKTLCDGVLAAVQPLVVKNGSKGSGVTRSNGVSICFPTNGVSPLYRTLDFARNGRWARFLAAY
jgi:hypothetical protein